MNFEKVDIENWARKEYYETYMNVIPCTYSMSVKLDITNLRNYIKENKLKFFPVILFAISKILNDHKEFKMGFNDKKELGYFSCINPSYTIFHEDTQTFSSIWSEYNEDINEFYKNVMEDLEKYKDIHKMVAKDPVNNSFNFSSLPWVNFESFSLNLQKGYEFLAPIITVGKFYKENDKISLPLSFQIHHSVSDGFHAARFVNELQEFINKL